MGLPASYLFHAREIAMGTIASMIREQAKRAAAVGRPTATWLRSELALAYPPPPNRSGRTLQCARFSGGPRSAPARTFSRAKARTRFVTGRDRRGRPRHSRTTGFDTPRRPRAGAPSPHGGNARAGLPPQLRPGAEHRTWPRGPPISTATGAGWGRANAQGYGEFRGQGGHGAPVGAGPSISPRHATSRRSSGDDLPGASPPLPPEVAAVSVWSTTGHWDVPVLKPATMDGARPRVSRHTWPDFNGPERSKRPAAITTRRPSGAAWLDGAAWGRPAANSASSAPRREPRPAGWGEGRTDAITAPLADPRSQGPPPGSAGGVEAASHRARE